MMKNVLSFTLSLLFFAFSLNAQPPDPAEIRGQREFCDDPSPEGYIISASQERQVYITITGGTIDPSSLSGRACNDNRVPDFELKNGNTKLIADAGNLWPECDFTINIDVIWDPSAPIKRIKTAGYLATETNTMNVFVHYSNYAYIVGPGNFVCQSYTGSLFYVDGVRSPADYQWSATSSGAPVSFSSTTFAQTTISGFTPNNYYTINCAISCEGQLKKNVSYTVVTGNSCRQDGSPEIERIERISRSADVTPFPGSGNASVPIDGQTSGRGPSSDFGAPNDQIRLFPNPVSQSQLLDIIIPENSGFAQLSIFDAGGQAVRQITITDQSNYQLNTGELPAGFYLAQFTGDAVRETRRFVVTE